MPYCPHCGGEVNAGAQFCSRCGQEMATGAAAPSRFAPSQSPESYRMKVGEYLKTGWAVFMKYPGGFIGFTLLSTVFFLGIHCIPYLGYLADFAIAVPLEVGPFIVAARLLQGRNPEFKEFFFGFHYLVPFLLMNLVVVLYIMMVGAIPYLILLTFVTKPMVHFLFLSLLVLIVLAFIVLSFFLPMLMVDRRLSFLPALELSRQTVQRNILGVLGFLGILFLISLAGLLCLLVGSLVAAPLVQCAMASAYADIFGLQSSEY